METAGLANGAPLALPSLQAAAARAGTDTHGIASGRDHPYPRAHPGAQLPAHQAEPLQQPHHHALRLPQVRGTSARVGCAGKRPRCRAALNISHDHTLKQAVKFVIHPPAVFGHRLIF